MAMILSDNNSETLALVRVHEMPNVWPAVAPMIQRAIDKNFGEHTLEDIRKDLIDQDMVLFVLHRNRDNEVLALCVLSIIEYEQVRACRIIILSGFDMNDWMHYGNLIELWAVDHGCQRIEAVCRPGFKRVMKPFGYEARYVTLIKDMNITRH